MRIDDTPPQLNGAGYYHEVVAVNAVVQSDSQVCLPVYADLVQAVAGSTVCTALGDFLNGVTPDFVPALDALPTVTGAQLSVPWVRVSDGTLVSANLHIRLQGPVELLVDSTTSRDHTLTPVVEATFDAFGVLTIPNLIIGQSIYTVQAGLVPNSDPARFVSVTLIQTGTVPPPTGP